MAQVFGNELVISGSDIVFVHSKKLNETMAIFLINSNSAKDGMPLTGLLIRGQTPAQLQAMLTKSGEPSTTDFRVVDYDKGEDFSVSGMVMGQKLDYSVSVEDDGVDLKLTMLLSLLRERKTHTRAVAKDPDNFNYNLNAISSDLLRNNKGKTVPKQKETAPHEMESEGEFQR